MRELKHPTVEIEEHDEGYLIRFIVPGSKFGPVEVVLDQDEVDDLMLSLDQAEAFRSTQ